MLYGVTSNFLDYGILVIGSNMGITHMTKEHIALCLSFKIPFFVIVT